MKNRIVIKTYDKSHLLNQKEINCIAEALASAGAIAVGDIQKAVRLFNATSREGVQENWN